MGVVRGVEEEEVGLDFEGIFWGWKMGGVSKGVLSSSF